MTARVCSKYSNIRYCNTKPQQYFSISEVLFFEDNIFSKITQILKVSFLNNNFVYIVMLYRFELETLTSANQTSANTLMENMFFIRTVLKTDKGSLKLEIWDNK